MLASVLYFLAKYPAVQTKPQQQLDETMPGGSLRRGNVVKCIFSQMQYMQGILECESRGGANVSPLASPACTCSLLSPYSVYFMSK
ncbi:hypothetical protein BDV23DRAFT_96596 [Aspergillus alliaceus]|uniref:Uncharacterized protein n=1 Tax=Petromyces alliaceus TaxID=209559 RepID=A0A5N7CP29_PETAA|nr:hypothetical protein BDV23DRAFT_96596 [Aspergillus alliaceus]